MRNYALRFAGGCMVFAGTMLLVWTIGRLTTDAVAMLLGMFMMLLASVPMAVLMAGGGHRPQRRRGDNVHVVQVTQNNLHLHVNELSQAHAQQLPINGTVRVVE